MDILTYALAKGNGSGGGGSTPVEDAVTKKYLMGVLADYDKTLVKKDMVATTATLEEGKFYVWGEMQTLNLTIPSDGIIVFRFMSGSRATNLSISGATMPDNFTVTANRVYDVTVTYGYASVESWSA